MESENLLTASVIDLAIDGSESNTLPLRLLEEQTLCLDANAAACTLYGYSRTEMVWISAKELRPPEEVERFERFVAQEVIHGDAGTWIQKRKDGTNFTVNIRQQIFGVVRRQITQFRPIDLYVCGVVWSVGSVLVCWSLKAS